MELSRKAAPPQAAVRSFARPSTDAPYTDAPRGTDALELVSLRSHRSPPVKREKAAVFKGDSVITRKDYPVIVELRIAGRSEREIAKRLDVPIERLKVHMTRALAEYRRGELNIRGGEAVEEARKVGEDKAQEFSSDVGGANTSSSQATVAVSIAITA